MDPLWLFVILILIVLFASISIVGALHRIRDASERAAQLLEKHLAETDSREPSH